ncbi:motilin-like [Oncorhynchus clarkii lewisi]|uniref:motilin-like n=1 Tax=Oncorhynchus clarkii lewisi TaxID=490388 RepID=UPI0039B8507B
MRGAVTGCVVLVCLVAMLHERAEGHFSFFSPKEMREMKDKLGRKDMEPRSEDGQFQDVTNQQLPEDDGGTHGKTVEISVRLTAKQLEHVAPVLEDIIHEMVEQAEKKDFDLFYTKLLHWHHTNPQFHDERFQMPKTSIRTWVKAFLFETERKV